ncbi:MAG: M20/M25/M40 family metallo-hydrolase [Anaerolineae bacterium]|nr:M20/M25/M40 family metallo-hydrolase [Anaerolineae bacterium]
MKTPIVLLFVFVLLLSGLAGGLPAQTATLPETEQTLVYIVTAGMKDHAPALTGVTIYAYVVGRSGTAVIAGTDPAGLAALAASGLTYQTLEQIPPGAAYYLVYPLPGRANAAPNPEVVALLADADWRLVRATPVGARGLSAQGMALQAISFDPKPWLPDTFVPFAPFVVDPDPTIQSMMDQVSSGTVYQYDGDLSGMWPVMIGGSSYTIATRHTYSGTPIQKATQYVGEHFTDLGLAVEYHQWSGSTYPNVIATIPGLSNPDEIYIVSAHLDDMPSGATAPGADDNASGVVAALIAADIFSQHQWDCTLRFGLWTGEEQGLNGSHAYAQRSFNNGENIAGVLNLDMIAWNTPGSARDIDIHATSTIPATLAQAQLFVDVIDAYDLNLIPQINPNGTGASDHASFWQYGYAAILGIEDFSDFNPYYHTTNDLLSNVDLDYFTEFVRASVGTFAHLTGCLVPGGVGYLDGEVTAQGSGDPIAGVTVTMAAAGGGMFTAVTDPTGYYTRTLLADTYTVTAQAEGYLPITIPDVVIITDTVTTQDFALPLACEPVDIVDVVTTINACVVDFAPTYTGTPPITWDWAFPAGAPPTSQSQNPQGIDFAISGTYAYSVTASSCGGTAVDTFSSQVTVSCDVCTPLTAVSLDTLTISPIYAGDNVTFTAALTPELSTLPYTYTVWVDGTAVITNQVDTDMPLLFDYTFAAASTYTVTVSVSNCEAGTAVTDSLSVTVLPVQQWWWVYLPVVVRP